MTARPITEIGAAVVGTGLIGVIHVEALRRLGVQVRGVVGSSHSRAVERAKALALPPAYESFEAMLADPRVDVVHITSPNHLHYPQAKAALVAGKHVICEKPLTMTSNESAELVRLGGGERADQRGQLQPALLSDLPAPAPVRSGGRSW